MIKVIDRKIPVNGPARFQADIRVHFGHWVELKGPGTNTQCAENGGWSTEFCDFGKNWRRKQHFHAATSSNLRCWARTGRTVLSSPWKLSNFVEVGRNFSRPLWPNNTLAGILLSHLPQVVSERRCLMIEARAILDARNSEARCVLA
jgi:hypothetical protein